MKFYNDKLISNDGVSRNMIHKIWLHCCRKFKAVTLDQLIAWQPHAEEWLRCYDRFVDAEGKTTLN